MAFNNGQKVTALLAARMGSSRFQGKTLADLHGQPMLKRLVERIRQSRYVDDVVVATTELEEDGAIEDWCEKNSVGCFRGSASDVLGRLNSAVVRFNLSTVVEVLGDNPLVHSAMIDASVELFFRDRLDYVATLTNEYPKAAPELRKFPIGVRVQVLSADTFKRCAALAILNNHREHATSFIAEHPDVFKTGFVEAKDAFAACYRPELTFAVNFKKNMELIRNIFREGYDRNPCFGVEEAIGLYDANPEWHRLMGND